MLANLLILLGIVAIGAGPSRQTSKILLLSSTVFGCWSATEIHQLFMVI